MRGRWFGLAEEDDKMEILRERHRILAQDGDYHIIITVDDRAGEIGDASDSMADCLARVLDLAEAMRDGGARG